MARPTIRDVATCADVSTATVSYVLNETGSVSESTATRVRACVKELGYRANSVAVAHRTGRTKTIGLAVPDLTNGFFPEFAQGVHRAAANHGFAVVLLDADNSIEAQAEGIDMLADRVPEGLILCLLKDDFLEGSKLQFPTVVFDHEIEGIDCIRADLYKGGRLQAEAVVAHGHRRIGLVCGPEWSGPAAVRRRGVLENLSDSVEVVWEHSLDWTADLPATAVADMLQHDVTCVVTGNDMQAFGVLQMYRNAGRSVPEDVSIVGFDDIDFAALANPSLSTVRLPTRELGATAFRMLVQRIESPSMPVQQERLDVQMMVRDSLRSIV